MVAMVRLSVLRNIAIGMGGHIVLRYGLTQRMKRVQLRHLTLELLHLNLRMRLLRGWVMRGWWIGLLRPRGRRRG